jgi:DNA-binding GntR family transcriptional regulator
MVETLDKAGKSAVVRGSAHTLHQQVLEQIRSAILFGQVPVGERLREVELAARLGVSRVPVREALRQLERESLVQSSPHRGTVVMGIDEQEVDLLYHFRSELEAFAVRAVTRRPNLPEIVGRLQGLLDAMRLGARTGDVVEIAENDLEFHRTIVAGSDYRILARVWRSMDGPIRARVHRALNGPYRHVLVSYTAESHQPVVAAVASGDEDRAATALREHILETRELIERGLSESADPSLARLAAPSSHNGESDPETLSRP